MFGKPVDVIDGLEITEILFFSAVLLNPKCQPRMGIPFLQKQIFKKAVQASKRAGWLSHTFFETRGRGKKMLRAEY